MTDYPEVVYKYRDWSDPDHKRMLLDNETFLTSPEKFNDPFDCRITKNYTILDTDEKRWEYIEKTVKSFNLPPDHHFHSPEKKEEIFNRLKFGLEDYQNEADTSNFNSVNKHFGVFSLSAKWDSILMWGHYSNKHRGFCVGFYTEELRKTNKFGKGGLVNYSDDFPLIDPRNEFSNEEEFIKESFLQTHTKASDWQYEEEFRLQTTKFPDEMGKEDRIVIVPDSCFAEIIIGLNCSDEDKNEIFKLGKRKKIPVYQTIKVPFKFKIERKRII